MWSLVSGWSKAVCAWKWTEIFYRSWVLVELRLTTADATVILFHLYKIAMCDSVDRELTEGYDYDDDELSSTSSDTTEEWADVLDEGSSELCLVCLENEVMEFDRRPCCDHPICQTCLEKYIWSKVDDGVFRVGCPNPKCYSHLQVDEVTRIDPELAQLFYRRLVDANSDPHRKTCPNCCRITEVDPSTLDDRKAHDYGLLINCTQCQFQWCFQCHGPQHQGLKCDKNRASDHLLRKWAERRQSGISPTAQQCPVCKVIAASNLWVSLFHINFVGLYVSLHYIVHLLAGSKFEHQHI